MPTRPLTAAERQRRLRYRRRHNLLLVQVEVPVGLAEALMDAGLLSDEAASDAHTLGDALVTAAKRLINGA